MVSTVGARPNHYETLGLSPGASEVEIADAFARAISTPRGLGGIAEASIAYEALRDPERRKAYDRSIGLGEEPEPEPAPPSPSREWSPFLIRAAARPAGPPAHDPLPVPQPPPDPQPEPKPFIAAPPPVAAPPEPAARAAPLPPVAVHFAQAEEVAIDWKRTAIVAGAVVLGVGLVGAWAGLAASSDIEAGPQPQAKQAVTMKLAPPEPLPAAVAAAPAASPARSFAQPRRARTAPAPRPQSRADRVAEIKRGLEDYYATTTGVDTPQPTAPVQAASMPLSSAVVARTIHRIGYPCGAVASTESAGGGVFNVTCTSGHSYRAAPVRGRYHFRRVR